MSDGRSDSRAPPDRSKADTTDTNDSENQAYADEERKAIAAIVAEFLDRDLLSESVSEKVSRHYAAGNHREALRLIVDARRDRRSR